MSVLQTALLAAIQGLTELLPVSSSAHVILVGKTMGFDPGSPEGVLTLLFLHTGTMFAVLVHYWRHWLTSIREGGLKAFVLAIVLATGATGVVGFALKVFLEKIVMAGNPDAEVEHLFRSTPLVAGALGAAGILIIIAAKVSRDKAGTTGLSPKLSLLIGAVQGLCLPFRGFSRSGATISVGLMAGLNRISAEAFSFALAVVVTPPLILRELHRLKKAPPDAAALSSLAVTGSVGLFCSFIAGLLALRWLSSWVERGKWQYFGYYCLAVSSAIFIFQC